MQFLNDNKGRTVAIILALIVVGVVWSTFLDPRGAGFINFWMWVLGGRK
jgi:hypothetical protein